MASLYIMMTLTYWFNIGAITEGTTKILGLAPVWIKIGEIPAIISVPNLNN